MPLPRQNPDELLRQVQSQESQAGRGSLKIFFGYAAGVGKTYAMLENAHRWKESGREVVAGYVEPHARPETQALLEGLEILPPKEVEYRGVVLREFDVDAALKRHPELILVDELAHTNAEDCRHAKRWQDIEELLEAGINVWTTLNVQHIESLNDVIGQITGMVVRETIPDQVFDSASELELIDITPSELLSRLQAGKVYLTEQAEKALQNFFQRNNLIALRELSLRQTARRVHSDVEVARRQKQTPQPWATNERLLVCIGPSPTTARVIRTAKRMSMAFDAPWMAVSIEVPGRTTSTRAKQQIAQHFRLAERLGAETASLVGETVPDTLLDYARSRNVTKILIGKTNQPRWRRLLFGTVVDEVLEKSGDIDLYVIQGEEEKQPLAPPEVSTKKINWRAYLGGMVLLGSAGLLADISESFRVTDSEADTVMFFLAAVVCTAYWLGRGPAILTSVLAVLVFDFFFVPPLHTFSIADAKYIFTFAVMLAIGLVISTLTHRLKFQIEVMRQRERRVTALHQLSKQLSSLYGSIFLIAAAGKKIAEMTGGEVAIYRDGPKRTPEIAYGQETSIAKSILSLAAVQWVIDHEQIAGKGTNTLPNAPAVYLPMTGTVKTYGAIAIRTAHTEQLLEPDHRSFLESSAQQLALALERDFFVVEASNARVEAEAEQLRSSLLSGVSHDLKTPLAAIAGASSSLLEAKSLDEHTQRQLLETMGEEATRLNRLLENILQMSKLDAGVTHANKQWHVLEEIIGSALQRTSHELERHHIQINLPIDLPLILVDGLLLEQIFVNLLENAARHTPPGTKVDIIAVVEGEQLRVIVADNGPGLPRGAETKIFEKFYRAHPQADAGRGSGLGLAISQAIARVHGGSLAATHRSGGGTEFHLLLPLEQNPPQITVE
jgi:two-component system sensor histidine kinase KdpD